MMEKSLELFLATMRKKVNSLGKKEFKGLI